MQHSTIPAQAIIDLAPKKIKKIKNEGDKFLFGVGWKDINKTIKSGKYVLLLKDVLLFAHWV